MLSVLLAIALSPAQKPEAISLTVGGIKREAVLYRASGRSPAPLVFVFHGFGGTSRQAARSYKVHEAWPEANVVYPQGLIHKHPRWDRTAPGWQRSPGDVGDRDLKFVDALLAELPKRASIDPTKTFSCGMSNGGLFTFILLHSRPEKFAAFAPIAAGAGVWIRKVDEPRPTLLVFGKNDELVSFKGYELSRNVMLRRFGAVKTKEVWMPGFVSYEANGDNPIVERVHDGGHDWPDWATGAIVKFFKEAKPLKPTKG